jgi:hypothetical protein
MVFKILSFLLGSSLALLLAFGGKKEKPAVGIQVDYGQFVYKGLDAPLIIFTNTTSEQTVEGSGIEITHSSGYNYNARATRLGKSDITVSAAGLSPQRHTLEVMPYPGPQPRLGGNPKNKGGTMGNGEFKAQGGISAISVIQCHQCDVVGYTLTYQAKNAIKAESVYNIGARFTPEAQALINQAKPGDHYFFEEIKAKCPGDTTARVLPLLHYTIK